MKKISILLILLASTFTVPAQFLPYGLTKEQLIKVHSNITGLKHYEEKKDLVIIQTFISGTFVYGMEDNRCTSLSLFVDDDELTAMSSTLEDFIKVGDHIYRCRKYNKTHYFKEQVYIQWLDKKKVYQLFFYKPKTDNL